MYDDSYKPKAKEALEELIKQNTLLLSKLGPDPLRRLIDLVDEPRSNLDAREVAYAAGEAVNVIRQAIASLNKLAFLLP